MSSSKLSIALPFEISATAHEKMTLDDFNNAYTELCKRVAELSMTIDGGYPIPMHHTGLYNALKDRAALGRTMLAKIEEDSKHHYWPKDDLADMAEIIETQLCIDYDALKGLEVSYPHLRQRTGPS